MPRAVRRAEVGTGVASTNREPPIDERYRGRSATDWDGTPRPVQPSVPPPVRPPLTPRSPAHRRIGSTEYGPPAHRRRSHQGTVRPEPGRDDAGRSEEHT